MALINCPECGNECSDQAESCPKCGYPFRNHSVQDDDEYIYSIIRMFCTSRKPDKIQKKVQRKCKGWEIVSINLDSVASAVHTVLNSYNVTVRKKK